MGGVRTWRRAGLAPALVGLALAVGGPVASTAWPKDDRAAVYAKDVDFLLTELEKKAGHFFAAKGIDWKKVSAEFRSAVKKVKSDGEHVKLCSRLLARLKDGHATLMDLKVPFPDESDGRRFTGPRVHLLTVDKKVYVRAAFGEAARQGFAPGMEVLAIDDVPARTWLDRKVDDLCDVQGFSTDHAALYAACHRGLADWSGTRITFDVRSGGAKRRLTVVRDGGPNYAPFGPVFPPKGTKTLGRQTYGKTDAGFGYVHLRDVPQDLPAQLDQMLGEIGDVPGLVLDMRANGGGGCDHEAVFGRFLAPGAAWRQYRGQGSHPYPGPMVVIVDAGVASAGETVAGMFGEDGRAYLIGESATAGMSAQKEKLPVPSGLFAAYFAVASNKGRFNGGKGIEGLGVPPDEVVPYVPSELEKGVDTQIRRAEELLRAGLPKGKVPYVPPAR